MKVDENSIQHLKENYIDWSQIDLGDSLRMTDQFIE